MVNNQELQQIMEVSGAKPNQCNCSTCQQMCMRAPCMGTPEDILKLAEAGHADKLEGVRWATGHVFLNMPIIAMIQLKLTDKGCIMLKNGLCTLHESGLKPTEGVLSSCKNNHRLHENHLSMVVARTWLDDHNCNAVEKLVELIKTT